MSRVIRCDPRYPDDTVLNKAAEVLDSGGVIVIPTETQYGLAIRADRDGTLDKICRLKKRDANLRPALFVKDIEMAENFCIMNNDARRLADNFLPGPLTLVLAPVEGQASVSRDYLSDDGYGIRISSSPVVAGIMNRLAFAVSATSANISGQQTPTGITEIEKLFGDDVELYLDGGLCRAKTPSTVVKVNGGIKILRHGQIAEKVIKESLSTGGGHE